MGKPPQGSTQSMTAAVIHNCQCVGVTHARVLRRHSATSSGLQSCSTVWLGVVLLLFADTGARQMQLMPSTGSYTGSQSPLSDVTIVFASVANASNYAVKRSRSDTKYLNNAIRRCMLQQIMAVPGNDGYLCRCQGDLKYMVAFEQPHRALQWCLAVQVRSVTPTVADSANAKQPSSNCLVGCCGSVVWLKAHAMQTCISSLLCSIYSTMHSTAVAGGPDVCELAS